MVPRLRGYKSFVSRGGRIRRDQRNLTLHRARTLRRPRSNNPKIPMQSTSKVLISKANKKRQRRSSMEFLARVRKAMISFWMRLLIHVSAIIVIDLIRTRKLCSSILKRFMRRKF